VSRYFKASLFYLDGVLAFNTWLSRWPSRFAAFRISATVPLLLNVTLPRSSAKGHGPFYR